MTEPTLPTQLLTFVDAPDDNQALTYLQSQRQTLLTTEALAVLTSLLAAETNPERRQHMQARQAILQAAIAFYERFWQTQQALRDLLVAWVQTPDWEASEAYLQEHATTLVSEQGELTLRFLCETQPTSTTLAEHLTLLQQCRRDGIATAYQAVRRPQPESREALQHLLRAVFGFVQAESDALARQLFETQPTLLQIPDAEDLLEGLLHTARQQDDPAFQAQVEKRLKLYRSLRRPTTRPVL
jgi:hypothetical protein